MAKELKSSRFIMSVEPSFIARLDKWRRKQEDMPSRAEAVRRLTDLGLSADELADKLVMNKAERTAEDFFDDLVDQKIKATSPHI